METTHEKITEVLHDLARINNDRIEGYEKAATETKDTDLKAMFNGMAGESKGIVAELTHEIKHYGGDTAQLHDTTITGKIYRVWMDVKTSLAKDERQSVLNACEFGEDAAQKAYHDALNHPALTPVVKTLIQNQMRVLKNAHDLIKRERDMENTH